MFERRHLKKQMDIAAAMPINEAVQKKNDGEYKIKLTDRNGKAYSMVAFVLSELASKNNTRNSVIFTAEGYGYKPMAYNSLEVRNEDVFGSVSIDVLNEDDIKKSILGYIHDNAGVFNKMRHRHKISAERIFQADINLVRYGVFSPNIDD